VFSVNQYPFNCRDVDLTEKLDYTSAVAVLGYSLLVSIMRSFNVRDEAARVMVAAPLLAFIATHILYLINFKMDYGMIQCPVFPLFSKILFMPLEQAT